VGVTDEWCEVGETTIKQKVSDERVKSGLSGSLFLGRPIKNAYSCFFPELKFQCYVSSDRTELYKPSPTLKPRPARRVGEHVFVCVCACVCVCVSEMGI